MNTEAYSLQLTLLVRQCIPGMACRPSSWRDSTTWDCTSSWDVRGWILTSLSELKTPPTTTHAWC